MAHGLALVDSGAGATTTREVEGGRAAGPCHRAPAVVYRSGEACAAPHHSR